MASYDEAILQHYASVADKQSQDDSCTMDDHAIRDLETSFLIRTISSELSNRNSESNLSLADYGCGNGYTLVKLSEEFSDINFLGFEYTPELRTIANQKLGIPCDVLPGDVRDPASLPKDLDIVICQRVLINLLDPDDQRVALNNIVNSISPGGLLLSIEAFSSNLDVLNTCRRELGLRSIPPAHHNLYLNDDFFDIPELISESTNECVNYLSTHYFVTRVLHDVALASTQSPFVRNSLFVKFFDSALPPGVGEFSPLRCNVFRKS